MSLKAKARIEELEARVRRLEAENKLLENRAERAEAALPPLAKGGAVPTPAKAAAKKTAAPRKKA